MGHTTGRIRWMWWRMRSMSPAELPHRVVEAARRGVDRLVPPVVPDAKAGPLPAWPVPPLSLSPDARHGLERDLEGLLEGEFAALGVDWPPGSVADWRLDPATGSRWPDFASATASLARVAEGRDVKLVWELGRLQHAQVAALAARVLQRREGSDLARSLLESWCAAHPPFRGVAYLSGVELASRMVSIFVVVGAVEEDLPPELSSALWRTLEAHAAWLERYPSLHSSANNHRMAELAALVLLGCLAPDHPRAGAWREHRHELAALMLELFTEEGVPAEQSLSYGAVTLEWVLLVRQALRRRGLDLGVDDRIAAVGRFLASMLDERGHHPRIGDDDASTVLRTRSSPEGLVRSVAASALGLAGEGERVGDDLRAQLLGVEARWLEAPPQTLQTADLTVWRRGRLFVVMDHGPLGFGNTAAHGHGDCLAVWLHLDGRPLLVDSGVFRYNGASDWRAWARSTAAHNTVNLDGEDVCRQVGAFNWGPRRPTVRVRARDDSWLTADHDGYRPAIHERRVEVDEDVVVVQDRVFLSGGRTAAGHWHLAPGVALSQLAENTYQAAHPEGPRLRIQVLGPVKVELIEGGGDGPGPGVHSPSYGRQVSACCLRIVSPTGDPWTTRFEVVGEA